MILLESERLIIRNFQVSDWKILHEIIIKYQESEFAPYDQQWPTSQEEIKRVTEWFANGDSYLAVCIKESKTLIGFVGLNPEKEGNGIYNIGYVFDLDYHRQGYATEACRTVLHNAFDQLNINKIITGTASINLPSIKLLEGLGFQKIGEEKVSFSKDESGKPIEFIGYQFVLTTDKWKNN
jgi:RimJ/RimL family protein N-acetyltransferase